MRGSAPAAVERPELEDVAEEEEAFAAEGSSKSTLELSSCQVSACCGSVFQFTASLMETHWNIPKIQCCVSASSVKLTLKEVCAYLGGAFR